ncbi:hypothetical protein V6R85_01210 [Agrobacterium sp. CCNWLW32]|uniref:hypothetical protein n=1 Tax=Agrobacterium sp. CCNWLW32 TaxID=3122072 RepID=UPI00301000AE
MVSDKMMTAAVAAYVKVDKKCRPAAMRAALEAALSAVEPQPAPSVAVKALEWRQNTIDFEIWSAETILGPYNVMKIVNRWDVSRYTLHKIGSFNELDEAKAAAQADYEARIRSALSAQVQDVARSVIKLGTYGRAYDRPEERRAYTYEHQPGNIEAYKLGRACSDIHSGGDWIDRGLNLLNALQREGFGVFELPAAPAKQEGK